MERQKDSGYGYYNRYSASEIALQSICCSAKDNEHLLFVFVEARAFPVTMRLPVGVTAEAPAAQVIYNEGKDSEIIIPWGVSDPLSSHKTLTLCLTSGWGGVAFILQQLKDFIIFVVVIVSACLTELPLVKKYL